MKIAALEHFIAQLIVNLEQGQQLIAGPLGFALPDGDQQIPSVTDLSESDSDDLLVGLASTPVNIARLVELSPQLILTSIPANDKQEPISVITDWSTKFGLPTDCKIVSYNPRTLEQIYQMIEDLGLRIKVAPEAKAYAQRIKAQLMNWSVNFYDRCKRKKVIFLSSVEPLVAAGEWLADMVNLTGASNYILPGNPTSSLNWQAILDYRPDVILIAPKGQEQECVYSSFKVLEKYPNWDDIPAVKRGEVYFSAGEHLFYAPGISMIDSMAFIVSAIAGFESGYITKRDSFQRLRWLEMQRHRY